MIGAFPPVVIGRVKLAVAPVDSTSSGVLGEPKSGAVSLSTLRVSDNSSVSPSRSRAVKATVAEPACVAVPLMEPPPSLADDGAV